MRRYPPPYNALPGAMDINPMELIMIRIPAPLKTAATAALTTVTASADAITSTVTIVSALAETGSAHATAYRDAQIESIELLAAQRRKAAGLEAREKTAARIKTIQDRLRADEDLWDIFDQLGDKDFDVATLLQRRKEPVEPVQLHAAE